MNQERMNQLVSQYYAGSISAADHAELADTLKKDAEARKLFRELVDLEASLTTWANEDGQAGNVVVTKGTGHRYESPRSFVMGVIAMVASIVIILSVVWKFGDEERIDHVGSIREVDCQWISTPGASDSREIHRGTYSLESGVAQLVFESGTKVTMEGPCEMEVVSETSAKLVRGNAVVNVSEISDGFLITTARARVVDLGTEYGISIHDEGTEIHVFDGSVEWQAIDDDAEYVEINTGEAKLFSNVDSRQRKVVTFGRIEFVRQLELEIQNQGGGDLIAYDGFENLAGRIRRGRSGFGWTGGWTPPGRRRVNATIEDAPADRPFGISRSGRRELMLGNNVTTQRELESRILDETNSTIYVSLLISREANSEDSDSSFQLSLQPKNGPNRFRARKILPVFGFGMTSGSSPYVKCGGVINDIALRIPDGILLCVARFKRSETGDVTVKLRVYQTGESVENAEPENWTLGSVEKSLDYEPRLIQLSSGNNGKWRVDELKIGKTWKSVTSPSR